VANPTYRKVTWSEVTVGDVVYLDNYEGGLYPDADPKVSGPFVVIDADTRTLSDRRSPRRPVVFLHYPTNLLVLEENE
jgi:hypothetical protein